MWKNISDTIKYKDGTTVKLKAGQFFVIRPSEEDPTFYGYQIHYFCEDGYTRTFGASDKTKKARQVQQMPCLFWHEKIPEINQKLIVFF